jgi:probable rRNA maturation factor
LSAAAGGSARRVHELAVAVSTDGVRIPLARARAADLARGVLEAERVRDALLSITFVTAAAIARLNREHLGHSGPTDVISFGLHGDEGRPGPVVGDVYICPEVARKHAAEHGASLREELARLVVHGTLHVLGHDHDEGDDRLHGPMWRRQERLLATMRPTWGG